ncbi:MAG: S-layer homology domain-containing protein [Clostridiales bacterium]|nr:S-layer homology domain-containing protein [Clostridiales bacterium]
MKRFLSILVAVAMTISMVLPVFAYTDTEGNDYEAAIAHLSGLGVINGYEDGSFQPAKVVTRAEMAKLLVVALDLDAGADILTGESEFADVDANHWAIGFINVATSYGLIKGDGDGNFRPDDTVNYAEAATMALRALNYTSVVEKAGVWPTNYLNKANELRLFKDVAEFKASEGAKRGEVAQILWNMLNTKMWEVVQENENNGLTSTANRTMMEVKFADYAFKSSLVFDKAEASFKDGEYVVTLTFDGDVSYIYNENDFYTFVKGTEFEAVVYDAKDGDEIVTIFATDDNYLASGSIVELDDEYRDYSYDTGVTYEYLLLKSAKKEANSTNVENRVSVKASESAVVTEVKVVNKVTKIYTNNGSTPITINNADEAPEKGMFIKGDERVTALSLEEGDIITKIGDIYLVVENTITGSYDGLYVNSTVEKDTTVITIAGEDYDVSTNAGFKVYETDEDGDLVEVVDKEAEFAKEKEKDNKFLGETATYYFNAVGDLLRVVFGEVEDIAKSGSFYLVTTGKIWDVADANGSVDYIKLANAEGEKSYVIANLPAGERTALENVLVAGKVVYVEFNDDNEIEKAVTVTGQTGTITTDADYKLDTVAEGYNKDTAYINAEYKVTDSTVVFTSKQLKDKEGELTNPAEYELVVTTGGEALKGAAANKITVAYDEDNTILAKYVFVEGKPSSTDKVYGIVEAIDTTADKNYITVNGTKYERSTASLTTAEAGDAIIYTVDEEKITVQFVYSGDQVNGTTYKASTVIDVTGSIVKLDANGTATGTDDIIIDLDLLPTDNKAVIGGTAASATVKDVNGSDVAISDLVFEDFKVFELEVALDKDDAPYFTSFEEVELNAVKVTDKDGIAIRADQEIIVIIKGYDFE